MARAKVPPRTSNSSAVRRACSVPPPYVKCESEHRLKIQGHCPKIEDTVPELFVVLGEKVTYSVYCFHVLLFPMFLDEIPHFVTNLLCITVEVMLVEELSTFRNGGWFCCRDMLTEVL